MSYLELNKFTVKNQIEEKADKFGESEFVIETKKAFYQCKIEREIQAENPLHEFDMLGTIAIYDNRYFSGHEDYTDIVEHMNSLLKEKKDEFNYSDYDKFESAVKKQFDREFLFLPIYAYIHSGVTISTNPFSCRWDSGLAGFIYVSKEDVRKEYDFLRITKKRQEKILSYLQGNVETFDCYLTGEVYSYTIYQYVKTSEKQEFEYIDSDIYENEHSCWGFYNTDEHVCIKNYIYDVVSHLEGTIDGFQQEFEFFT